MEHSKADAHKQSLEQTHAKRALRRSEGTTFALECAAMKTTRREMTFLLAAGAFLAACGGEKMNVANIKPDNMPDGETWTGVYYHPVYGYLHMVESDNNVIGKWKRTDQSAWGELSGVKTGNVLHYQWKEHKYGMVGPSSVSAGKGYFKYSMGSEGFAVLDGQFGVGDDETGADWACKKQVRMNPDLNSIKGDTGGGSEPVSKDKWQ